MTSYARIVAMFFVLASAGTPANAERLVLSEKQSALVRKRLSAPAGAADEQYGAKRTLIDIGKHKGFILQPAKPAAEGARPWVWYAPTIGSYPNASNEWVLRKLLDCGFCVCGVNVGESHGSPAGRKVYSEFHQYVVREFNLESRARLLAQSRGGLMLYNWAAENPDKVRCIVGIYPVCDLRSYPGLQNASGAYGLTPAELEKQLSQHNPIDGKSAARGRATAGALKMGWVRPRNPTGRVCGKSQPWHSSLSSGHSAYCGEEYCTNF